MEPRESTRVSEFRADQATEVLELFQTVYPGTDPKSFLQEWAWKYEDNPWRTRYAWVALAERAGRVVGFCGAYPSETVVAGARVRSATLVDGVTHPSFRGLGVFTEICRYARESLRAQGVTLTFGFPNSAALPSHLRAGAMRVATWKRALLPRRGSAVGARLRAEQMFNFSRESDAVWRAARKSHGLSLDRSPEFMRWRFLRRPGVGYRIWAMFGGAGGPSDGSMVAVAVTSKGMWRGRSVNLLMDLVVDRSIRRRAAVRALADPLVTGIEGLTLLLSPHAVGRGEGFPISRLPLIVYSEAPIRLPDPSTWNVSFTDVDYL